MKILIIEDNAEKLSSIESLLQSELSSQSLDLHRSSTLAEATKALYSIRFDLAIVDLMLPRRNGDEPTDETTNLIQTIQDSENATSNIIALSGFDDLVASQRSRFNEAGIILVPYTENDEWKKRLKLELSRVQDSIVFDFITFCVLEHERQAFRSTEYVLDSPKTIRSLDCCGISIGEYKGACIRIPRMGLTDTGITVARAIELFRPKVVAMSGICAGINDGKELGTAVVAESSWDYQSGKWKDGKFNLEPNSTTLHPDIQTIVSQAIEDGFAEPLYQGLDFGPNSNPKAILAPMLSGSSVVSDADRMQEITSQHRRTAAVDMEMSAMYRAAELSDANPIYIGVKTVVDTGDKDKSDLYQAHGSILSARIALALVEKILSQV